jgi:hypothetical protein
MGLTERGYYSYFSMPFGSRARISLVNESRQSPLAVEFKIIYRRTSGVPSNAGYFHAKWRREEMPAVDLHGHNLTGEYNYRLLDVHGRGRYIGANLNVFNRHPSWWGEGDPMIFVDDDSWPPSIPGTGTEDHFNDCWNFHRYLEPMGAAAGNERQNVLPISGVLLAGLASPSNCFGGNAVFGFHLADSIPFQKRILVTIEHGTENNLSNDYSSTAYWYAEAGAADFFVMRPAAERATIPVEQWSGLREKEIKPVLAVVRRDLAEVAAEIYKQQREGTAALPRDYDDMLVWRALNYAKETQLSDQERSAITRRFVSLMIKPEPEQERIAGVEAIVLELALKLGAIQQGVSTARRKSVK